MKLTIRLSGSTSSLDLNVAELDVTNVPAATKGSPTLAEVASAVSGKLFDGTVFPLRPLE